MSRGYFKKKLVKLLKSSNILVKTHNIFFRLINKSEYFQQIEKRRYKSLFSYKELSKDLPFYPIAKTKDTNFYGHYYWLKKYTNLESFEYSIEHGLYLGSHVPYSSYLNSTKRIITFSKNREYHLKNAGIDKPILKIGPYIHYVNSLLSDFEMKQLKANYGKILTVFPSHSIEGSNVRVNQKKILKKIKHLSADFDNVFICTYYKDIQEDRNIKSYEDQGYKIITAGHKYDLNFISRLKSIIELSDFTMSNTVGTHTGYCIYLNKPHYIFNQEISFTDERGQKSKEYRTEDEIQQLILEKEEIADAFKYYKFEITKNQRKVVDKYWGISEILSPVQLRSKLNINSKSSS